jgi:L-iditol 2-dehydrogenase
MYCLQARKYFDLKLEKSESRPPSFDEVALRVMACGVCGSDVHIMKRAEDYSPVGHEIAAEVVETGPGVDGFRSGDTVIVEDVTYCGVCRDCKNGNIHLCRNNHSLNGQSGLGEYLVVHKNSLVPYTGMDPEEACLTEPLAVALNTYLAAKVPLNGTLAVFGTGVLGLMCVRLAKHYGASRVVCVGSGRPGARGETREKAAYRLGADEVLHAGGDLEQGIMDAFGGNKADGVIVTSPPATVPDAMRAGKFGANIVVIGLDLGGNAKAEIDIDRLIMNKNTLVPVFAEPAKLFPLSMELLKTKVIDPALLVTHTFGLFETEKVRSLFMGDEPVIKAVMKTV